MSQRPTLVSPAGAFAAPVNDDFADAIELTGSGATGSANSSGGGRESEEPSHLEFGIPGGASVWWSWTAPRMRSVALDTCGSAFDAGVAVYRGAAVDALTELERGISPGTGTIGSQIHFVVTAGVT